MDKKGRFVELSTQEIQEIIDKAVPETTKKGTKLFNGTEAPRSHITFRSFLRL